MNDFVAERLLKRTKITKESTIEDISSTISDIADSVESINNSYRNLLKVNKAVVMFCLELQKRAKESSMKKRDESNLDTSALEESK